MAVARYKTLIGLKVSDALKKNFYDVNPSAIERVLNFRGSSMQFQLSFKSILQQREDLKKDHYFELLNIKKDGIIRKVTSETKPADDSFLVFDVDKELFIKDVLKDRVYFNKLKHSPTKTGSSKEKVLIEYSSPNVAKPFHMGHFRSTIIGNFLANLHEFFNHDVVRLTYLGDWGKQFGLLQIGLDSIGVKDEDLSKTPIETLFKAYVHANKMGESDDNIFKKANEIFHSMETGKNEEFLERWKTIRKYTVDELSKTYARLGVQFDDYDWESNYPASSAISLLKLLKHNGRLEDDEGSQVFVFDSGSKVPLLKSDGSSLYLTRDMVAALSRRDQYKFDRTIYVVDYSQQDHFTALASILNALEEGWSDRIKHVKFGRVEGMSTRKGAVVFLKDILDEAGDIMAEKQKLSATTKADLSEDVADILGVSAVMINDLKQRRLKNYEFSWDSAVQVKGDSGIKLQYTHCRLNSLEENCGLELNEECDCDPTVLSEPEAVSLVLQIARFDDIMEESYRKFESYCIVNYLFKLCNTVNKALKVLPVKDAPNSHIGLQRLLLFHSARIVLNKGMKILGLKPLDRM